MSSAPLPVRVPRVNDAWGILKSLKMARRNILSILPAMATKRGCVTDG
jgi:hypothetical protein